MERKEAIKVIKKNWPDSSFTMLREALETLIPELKESEDERIRKEMIEILKKEANDFPSSVIAEKSNSWIAWLEKQGENYIEKYINDERNKIGFYYEGKEVSWNEIPINVRKHDYPYYFKGDLDFFPFNIEKQRFINPTMIEKERIDNAFTKMMLKEQKPADKVEPKFKVGDWIIHNKNTELANSLMLVTGKDNNEYLCKDIDGQCSYNIEFIDKDYHLWTINDAKDGDVLFQDLMDGKTFIYNGINPNMAILYSFIISNDSKDILPYHIGKPNTGIGNIEENKNIIHPATKEQRDLLFAKMKEAGYEWDAEKKKLKKIEQKPAWSEEDEKYWSIVIAEFSKCAGKSVSKDEWMCCNDFLHSLRDRYTWKPSDEQLNALHDAAVYVDKSMFPYPKRILMKLYEQLKKLRED